MGSAWPRPTASARLMPWRAWGTRQSAASPQDVQKAPSAANAANGETCRSEGVSGPHTLGGTSAGRVRALLRHLASRLCNLRKQGLRGPVVHIRCTPRRAVEQHCSPEGLVDGSFGPLLGRWHQVGIDTQREPRVGVPQVLGEGAYRLASVEQHAGVEVPQCVHAVLAGRQEAGGEQRRLPDLRVDVVALQRCGLSSRQEQASWSRTTSRAVR